MSPRLSLVPFVTAMAARRSVITEDQRASLLVMLSLTLNVYRICRAGLAPVYP
jgi:hypothetical protein